MAEAGDARQTTATATSSTVAIRFDRWELFTDQEEDFDNRSKRFVATEALDVLQRDIYWAGGLS